MGVVLLRLVLFDREGAKLLSDAESVLRLRRLAFLDREVGVVLRRLALGVTLLLLVGVEGKSVKMLVLLQVGVVADGELGTSEGLEFRRLAFLDMEAPYLVGVCERLLVLFAKKEGSFKKPSSMFLWKLPPLGVNTSSAPIVLFSS